MNRFTLTVVLCGLIASTIANDSDQSVIQMQQEPDEYKGLLSTLTEKRTMKDLNSSQTLVQLMQNLGLTDLYRHVLEAELDQIFDDESLHFTVFGPTNEALENIPNPPQGYLGWFDYLTYYSLCVVLPSGEMTDELVLGTINGINMRINLYPKNSRIFTVATVQCTPIDLARKDNVAANGLIHVMDKAMVIPAHGSLMTTVQQAPGYSIFTKALKTTGLDKILGGKRPFTAFFPNDAAFNKLPPAVLASLLAKKKKLRDVLKYHLIRGTYCSAGLSDEVMQTLNKQYVAITVSKDHVKVNSALVIAADMSVTNGVGHGIDTVLFPPFMEEL